MPIDKLNNDLAAEIIDITAFLDEYGIQPNQLTDAIVVFRPDNSSGSDIITKTISGNKIVFDQNAKTISILFESADYGTGLFEADKTYFMALAFEYDLGSGAVRQEIELEDQFLRFIPDYISGW